VALIGNASVCRRVLGLWLVAFALGGVAGCGQAEEKWLPVQGVVRLGKAPLRSGTVIFQPDAAHGNLAKHEFRGTIDAQGRYTLSAAGRAGAPRGWYKAAVIAVEQPANVKDPYAVPRWLINPRFGSPDKSGLTKEVVENPGPGAYDLEVAK
jgi:hypothetical protein